MMWFSTSTPCGREFGVVDLSAIISFTHPFALRLLCSCSSDIGDEVCANPSLRIATLQMIKSLFAWHTGFHRRECCTYVRHSDPTRKVQKRWASGGLGTDICCSRTTLLTTATVAAAAVSEDGLSCEHREW